MDILKVHFHSNVWFCVYKPSASRVIPLLTQNGVKKDPLLGPMCPNICKQIMKYTDGVFAHHLQSSHKSLLSEEGCYDVVLEAEGRTYKAHKSVLAASSPYFRQMFTTKMFKEYKDDYVSLQLVNHLALEKVLQFIYTSSIEIDDYNIYLLMSAVDLFAMSSLKICIAKYLMSTLSIENSLGMYVAAETFHYHDLKEMARNFCLMNFQLLAENPELVDLPPVIFKSIVSSQLLNVNHEGIIVQAIIRWVKGDTKERQKHLPELFSHVKLRHIPVQFMKEVHANPILTWDSEFFRRVGDMLKDPETLRHQGGEPLDVTRRYPQEQVVMMAIGGESHGMASRTAECVTLGFDTWRSSIPEYIVLGDPGAANRVIAAMRCARMDAAVANDRHNVYVLGGRNSSETLDSCEAYNVQKNTWRPLPPLPALLDGCAATICDGRILVTGGLDSTDVWSLDPSPDPGLEISRHWTALPSLSQPRHQHCMVAAHGFVFVLGGFLDESELVPTDTMLRYDTANVSWLELPSMHVARAKFGSAVVDSCIYIMGGIGHGGKALHSVAKYDLLKNEWTAMRDMPTPRFHFSITVSNNRIFCLGGNDSTHRLHTVDKYNPRTDRWHSSSSMLVTRCGLAAATVYVPVYRDSCL